MLLKGARCLFSLPYSGGFELVRFVFHPIGSKGHTLARGSPGARKREEGVALGDVSRCPRVRPRRAVGCGDADVVEVGERRRAAWLAAACDGWG